MASFQHRAQEAVRRKGDNKCPYHRNKDVVFKCHDCNKLVCTACSTSTHRRHDLDEICDVIPDAKRKIQNYVTSAEQEQCQRLQAEIKKGEEIRSKNRQYYRNLISEIEKQRNILRSELDASFNDLIKTCHEMEQRREDVQGKHETQLKTMIDELKSQIKACKDALQSANNVLVCDISTDISTKYKDIPAAESHRLRITSSPIENNKKKWLMAIETLKTLGVEFMENVEKSLPLDHNPTKMDLEAPNRPSKLAEKFGELYDNLWTDAHEVFIRKTNEQNCIRILAGILKGCYEACENISIKQMEDVERVLTTLTIDSRSKPSMKVFPRDFVEARKECADKALTYVQKEVYEYASRNLKPNNIISLVPHYVKACTEVCWGMVVHEPKLCFAWPQEGIDTTVDWNFFSLYTRNGRGIEFVVWPAMLLHENGPLLRKGVVQPYDKPPKRR